MQLMTKEIREKLPPLYAQDGLGGKAVVYAKWFTPDSGWTWLATEGSPEGDDFIFFGLVIGLEKELGYFTLSELERVRGPLRPASRARPVLDAEDVGGDRAQTILRDRTEEVNRQDCLL